jgi:hypothetical protein
MGDFSIPLETQDQLAEIQHAIYGAVRSQCLEDSFVIGRFRALLGTAILASEAESASRKLTPGLLVYFEYELRHRLYGGRLDADLALQALTDLLKEGRQLAADRYTDRLTEDLAKLVSLHPKQHDAYQALPELVAAGQEGVRNFSAWLQGLAAVDDRWGDADLGHAFGLSTRLQEYTHRRKRIASETETQMRGAGFEPNSRLIDPVRQQAMREATMFALAFDLWDYVRRAYLKQVRLQPAKAT